jgi:hypothetical protein
MTGASDLAYLPCTDTAKHAAGSLDDQRSALPTTREGDSIVHKLILSCVLGFIVAGSTRAAFAAKTDVQVLTKFAHKFAAADVGAKPKSLCVCQDGTNLNGSGGYVIAKPNISSITRIEIRCIVPTFANDGSFLSELACATFTAIGK